MQMFVRFCFAMFKNCSLMFNSFALNNYYNKIALNGKPHIREVHTLLNLYIFGKSSQKFFSVMISFAVFYLTIARSVGIISFVILIADMAQLVEQLIRNEQVVGSSPTISSNKKALFRLKQSFFVYN